MTNQPKPEVKCEHKLNKNQMEQFGRDECTKCGEWVHLPSPASTEEWEVNLSPRVNAYDVQDEPAREIAKDILDQYWAVLKPEIKSLLSSHDQQLRQRIVEGIESKISELKSPQFPNTLSEANRKLGTELADWNGVVMCRRVAINTLSSLLTFITNL